MFLDMTECRPNSSTDKLLSSTCFVAIAAAAAAVAVWRSRIFVSTDRSSALRLIRRVERNFVLLPRILDRHRRLVFFANSRFHQALKLARKAEFVPLAGPDHSESG